MAGKICAACKAFLPTPHSGDETLCQKCQPKTRRIQMIFSWHGCWRCTFIEPYVQKVLPRTAKIATNERLIQFVERGRGLKDLETRRGFDDAVRDGKGSIYLELAESSTEN